MVIPLLWWIAVAVAAVLVAGAITWAAVEQWIEKNKIIGGTAHIVKERLQQGNYRVVCGVFGPTGTAGATTAWEADEIDTELDRRLEEGGGTILVHT